MQLFHSFPHCPTSFPSVNCSSSPFVSKSLKSSISELFATFTLTILQILFVICKLTSLVLSVSLITAVIGVLSFPKYICVIVLFPSLSST